MTILIKNGMPTKASSVIIPIINSKDLKLTLSKIAKYFGITTSLLERDFKAKPSEIFTFYPVSKNIDRIHLLGVEDNSSFSGLLDAFKHFSINQKDKLNNDLSICFTFGNYTDSALNDSIEAAINGLLVGTYDIGMYHTNKKTKHPLVFSNTTVSIFVDKKNKTNQKAAERGQLTAETQLEILSLVNAPSNKKMPIQLANWAKASGKKYGYKVQAFNKSQITKLKLDALLAVNRGSEYAPSFIVMEYKPKKVLKKGLRKIGLVGKGVTFDTGGLSIKGSANMHYMKSDMGGAAAVLGTMELAAKLQLQVHLIGIVPATDNCVDALAIKPGDVINSYSGKTIEVIDTDAEGRLILADGLAYMNKKYKPEIMIDLATLTGSAVRALGYQAGALFTNNEQLAKDLFETGESTGERLWRLPLWDAYKKDIQSDVADVKNFSGRPIAGAISAGKFLEVFTNEHPAWAHLDIAGVAFGSSPLSVQKSATAFGIRLLTSFLEKETV